MKIPTLKVGQTVTITTHEGRSYTGAFERIAAPRGNTPRSIRIQGPTGGLADRWAIPISAIAALTRTETLT